MWETKIRDFYKVGDMFSTVLHHPIFIDPFYSFLCSVCMSTYSVPGTREYTRIQHFLLLK